MAGKPSALVWVFVAIAAAAAGLVVALGVGGDGGEPEEGASATAQPPPAPPADGSLALAGRPAREIPTLGVDPTTGEAIRAELKFVTADGKPAPRVKATYRIADSEDGPLKGTADASGRLPLHAWVVGRRLLVDVAEGPAWGNERFDLWALDVVEVVLAQGCAAWLLLRPTDGDLIGRACAFTVDGVEHVAAVTGIRSPLGRFRGSTLELVDVDGWPAADGGQAVLLPPTGSVDVPWSGIGGARKRLRFEAPAGVRETPRVRLSAVGTGTVCEAVASGPDWVEFAVSPIGRTYVYLASCGEAWAYGRIEPGRSPIPERLPALWKRGCRLEAVLPQPGPAPWVRAYVVSDSARPLVDGETADVESHARVLQDPDMDWMDFGAERSANPAYEWPLEPDVTRSRIVWRAVPDGCVMRVVVAGTQHGTLSHDVTVPADAERVEATLHATLSFTLEIKGARTTLPGEEEWLAVACDEGRRGTCTVFLPREQHRVVVRGFPAGGTADVSVFGGGVHGEAHVKVEPDAVLPIVLRGLAQRRYRAKVTDAEGRPLAGVGVTFSGGHGGTGALCVRTDKEGLAFRDVVVEPSKELAGRDVHAGDEEPGVTARVSDPRFASAEEAVRLEDVLVLRAYPTTMLRLEFALGTRVVTVEVDGSGRPPLRTHVSPGSLLVLKLGGRPSTVVTVCDEEGEILFEQAVALSTTASTTVRVAR